MKEKGRSAMKRLLLAAVAVVAIGAAVPAALAAPAPKATGDVDWSYAPSATTGHVSFNAQGTITDAKGELVYSDSTGGQLHGVVTCYKQVNATTAVFSGKITDGSPGYVAPADPYFVAKVVDNGTPGTAGPDKIAVWANAGPRSCDVSFNPDFADVTGGKYCFGETRTEIF